MATSLVAAVDHGTSSTRCSLFDSRGVPIATARREQTLHYPKPGWVELDMDRVWRHTQECIHEALASAGASPADVAGIGITNQRETVVLWDRATGHTVAPAITWQDTGPPRRPTHSRPMEASIDSGSAPASRSRPTRRP